MDSKEYSHLTIKKVDERSMHIEPEGLMSHHEVQVEPGEHTFEVSYWKTRAPGRERYNGWAPSIRLTAELKAGHKYELKYRRLSEDSVCVWVEDAQTGNLVSPTVTTHIKQVEPRYYAPSFLIPLATR